MASLAFVLLGAGGVAAYQVMLGTYSVTVAIFGIVLTAALAGFLLFLNVRK